MKKNFCILTAALLLAFSLAGCSTQSETADASSSATPQTEQSSAPDEASSEEDTLSSSDTAETEQASDDASTSPNDAASGEENPHMLVAYFSRTGNTAAVANEIAAYTGADLFKIVPEDPYPEDYNETVERFRREREEDARPAVADEVENMADYDVLFVGYPIWGSTMPHVVRTFLESYDLSGKTIIPFCTSGGSGLSGSISILRELCPDSTLLDGFEGSGSDPADTDAWIDSLNLS